MGSLRKIQLDSSNDENSSLSIAEQKNNRPIKYKKIGIILIAILLFFAALLFVIVLPAREVYASAMKTFGQAKKTYEAIKKQNIELAGQELSKTREDLKDTQNKLHAMFYLQYIPIASGYYNDSDHIVKAGFYGIDALHLMVESIKPYADILGFKGQGSFVTGSAEQRIQTAVLTMGKITPRIDDIARSLVLAKDEIDKVDSGYYPSLFGADKIKKQITQTQLLVDQSVKFIDEARPLIKTLPSLLGESSEKKYLVLFQNDKELRPTGGFITAYAVFRIDKGIIHVDRSEDIYTLDDSIPNKPKAPSVILKYLKVPTFNIRDMNLSPDFIESMNKFDSFYEKSSNKVKVDGIIALDTHVLVSTIRILNDQIETAGMVFNTKDDPRCDCPQVIYTLENNITRPVGFEKKGRKDLLGILLYAIMEKALKSSPKLYWGPLFQDMFAKINEKHVLIYLFNKDAQSGIEAINAAGRIRSFDGDYLHINEANFGGAKSNLFVRESVTQEFNIEKDGSILKTLTIQYKNPHPPSDCNLERGGLCLNADLQNWIRIYVPKGSQLIAGESKGSEVSIESHEEFSKTVFEGFLIVRPLGSATYVLKYRLPFKLGNDSLLSLLIQKQPGTYGYEYSIKINGKEKEKFDLLTDKEFRLKIN